MKIRTLEQQLMLCLLMVHFGKVIELLSAPNRYDLLSLKLNIHHPMLPHLI